MASAQMALMSRVHLACRLRMRSPMNRWAPRSPSFPVGCAYQRPKEPGEWRGRNALLEAIGSIASDRGVGAARPAKIVPCRAGIRGRLASGGVMVGVALAYERLSGRGIWFPINLIGAALVRELQGLPRRSEPGCSPRC
jgi:hypothetical protein